MNPAQELLGVRLEPAPVRLVSASPRVVVLLYAGILGTAEALLALGWLMPSLSLHVLVLVAALVQFALGSNARYARALVVFALLALLRILSLSLPLGSLSPVYLNLLVLIPLLAGIWLSSRLLKLSPQALGLRRSAWWAQLLIAVSGLPIGLVAYLFLRSQPFALNNPLPFIPVMGVLLLTGLVEELLFRGMLAQVFSEILGTMGLVLSAILTGAMYFATLSPILAVWMAAVGLVFAVWFRHTRSIWGLGLAHGVMNVILTFGIPGLGLT